MNYQLLIRHSTAKATPSAGLAGGSRGLRCDEIHVSCPPTQSPGAGMQAEVPESPGTGFEVRSGGQARGRFRR